MEEQEPGAGRRGTQDSAIAFSRDVSDGRMPLGRPTDSSRRLVRGYGAVTLAEQFDLSGCDELPERGTIQNVVGDLTSAGQPEVQRLAAG